MHDISDSALYQLKVTLLGDNPMIWHRLLVRKDIMITDSHFVLQINVGWNVIDLHRFQIYGQQYELARIGGIPRPFFPNLIIGHLYLAYPFNAQFRSRFLGVLLMEGYFQYILDW